MRTRLALLAAIAVSAVAVVTVPAADAQGADPSQVGRFSAPFEDLRPSEGPDKCLVDVDGRKLCKPAGATMVLLSNGKVLYWDALEGTENIKLSLITEFGSLARNSRTRVLDLSGETPTFTTPTPEDGGGNPDGNDSNQIPGLPNSADDPADVVNDGDLFCSDQVQLADGRILAVGGSDYYSEPEIPGTGMGVVELEGLRNGRIFDPTTQQWSQTGSMQYGRWYPSLVTLPDGRIVVMSGVTKLLKPVYLDRPLDSGTNVKQVETYDPASGAWSTLPSSANRSLPLFPRLHLLPNGHVYYDAAGQSFNPFGQAYDETLWNIAASFDPTTGTWTDLGIPGLGLSDVTKLPSVEDVAGVGFRGSTFSVMLPLQPDATGQYRDASFLSAGGTLSAALPSPGTYLASNLSRVNTVSIDPATGAETLTTKTTGSMTTPRWYSTGVLLPTGDVMAFSGADLDEVATPSLGRPVQQAELFDAESGTWSPMATATKPRTYHNTAMLLPDGRVLVGGHAPISTLYLSNLKLPLANPNPDRDPSFEIYEPPYLFHGSRPTIGDMAPQVGYGGTLVVPTAQAASIESVVLMRNTALTHLIDGDQRSVVLPIVARGADSVTVQTPPNDAVAPRGPYHLFVNQRTSEGLVPSVGRQMAVGGASPPIPVATGTPAPTLPLPVPLPVPLALPTIPGVPATLPPSAADLLRQLLGGG